MVRNKNPGRVQFAPEQPTTMIEVPVLNAAYRRLCGVAIELMNVLHYSDVPEEVMDIIHRCRHEVDGVAHYFDQVMVKYPYPGCSMRENQAWVTEPETALAGKELLDKFRDETPARTPKTPSKPLRKRR